MRVVNEGALYSDRSKLSVLFYLSARSIRGRGVFEEIRYSEKTHLKKLMIMTTIIMNLSQETTVFGGRQKLTSTMKLRPEK